MNLTPDQMADLWYLRFKDRWVTNDKVQTEKWKKIVSVLMKHDIIRYQLVPRKSGYVECYQLKESYANS
jgi:hypothetical protein